MAEETATYKCSFCESPDSYACFPCGKRFCREHGEPSLAKCEECSNLEQIGDTYRFRLSDGRVIEDVSTIGDDELSRMLEMYARKVKELETLIVGARHQSTVLRRQLKLSLGGPELGKVSVNLGKTKDKPPPKSLGKDALSALADLLMQDPGRAKKLLEGK
ncbi:hypothetical protein LCGC14_2685670 [marine sediment metagenome]|uniref:Uncharacterized protein n=1 Tax=marine sediment metagenome TaxID=412755 RepID=A0A0F9CBR5_9ZZZZ